LCVRELAWLAPGATLVAAPAYRVGLTTSRAENAWTNPRARLQVIRMVASSSCSCWARRSLGLALVLGATIAAATLLPMVKGLTGSAAPYLPPAGWAAVLGGVVVLGSVSMAVPVRRVLRMQPVAAIGIRE
jgi:hypothetical protein